MLNLPTIVGDASKDNDCVIMTKNISTKILKYLGDHALMLRSTT